MVSRMCNTFCMVYVFLYVYGTHQCLSSLLSLLSVCLLLASLPTVYRTTQPHMNPYLVLSPQHLIHLKAYKVHVPSNLYYLYSVLCPSVFNSLRAVHRIQRMICCYICAAFWWFIYLYSNKGLWGTIKGLSRPVTAELVSFLSSGASTLYFCILSSYSPLHMLG